MTSHRDVRRRLDQFVANPRCEANTLSVLHDVSMEDVARAAGLQTKVGQSPFALARGVGFERLLFQEEAQRLRKALIQAGVLTADAGGFVDLRLRTAGGPLPSLDAACERFEQLVREWIATPLEARAGLPALIAAPAVCLPGTALLPDGMFAVDVLTLHTDTDVLLLRVGEVKVYPDRGGYTDAGQLAGARAQAGLYVHALTETIKAWGLESKVRVAWDGFLVLTRPGSNLPSVRAREDLRWQASRAERAFANLHAVAARASTLEGPSGPLEPERRLEAVKDAAKQYSEDCLTFCPLAEACHREALAAGSPGVLGSAAQRFLGTLTLTRAVQLLEGTRPETPAEEDFVRRALGKDTRGAA